MDNDDNEGKEKPMHNEHEEHREEQQGEEQRQAAEGLVAGESARPVPSDLGVTPGRKKRGPKTAAGKAKIRLNAVRYGIHATTLVIPGLERLEDWQVHLRRTLESCAPVGHLESKLAERIAQLIWRLERVTAAEQEVDARVNEGSNVLKLPPFSELEKFHVAEAHLNRQLTSTLHELEALQKRRRGESAPLARLDVNMQAG